MIKKLLFTALIIAGLLNNCQKSTKVKNQQNYYIKI